MSWTLRARSRVWVKVYNGTTIVRNILAGAYQDAGTHAAVWNGLTGGGNQAPEGAYKIQITATRGTTRSRVNRYITLTRPATPAVPNGRWIGYYVPGAPMNLSSLDALEAKVGEKAHVSNYFQAATQGFTTTQASNAVANGSIPLITLEFWNPANGTTQSTYALRTIAGGSHDTYLRNYARSAKAFGHEVWLRPLHEMNGNWYPWGGTVNGNNSTDFINAWRRMHRIFQEEGATNVKFVWSPNVDSVPNTSANEIRDYWPGESYVDYMALDGYNFGTSSSDWRSFDSVFGSAYSQVAALSAKPIFIAETGTGDTGGSKPAWMNSMFTNIPSKYPRIQGVVWFSADKERDWRVDCHPECLVVWKAGVAAW